VTFILPYFLLLYFRDNSSVSHWLEENDGNLVVQVYSFDSSFIRFAHIPSYKDIIKDFTVKIRTKRGRTKRAK